MSDIDELNALLEETRTIKKAANQIEKRLKAMLTERESEAYVEYADSETERRGIDIILERDALQRERVKSIRQIIRQLESEDGYAQHDKIVKRAAEAGFDKELVDIEIKRLIRAAELYEPVQNSGRYRLKR